MRKHFILTLLLGLTLATQARERTLSQKERAAAAVLAAQTAVRPVSGQSGAVPLPQLMRSTATYSVMGYPTGGFALIANDDNVEAVLGYSASAYDSTAVPAPVQWYLNSVEQALNSRPAYERASSLHYNTTGVPQVQPMCSTQWGQDEPYNIKCPHRVSGSGYMVRGCIATAMAQIMKHWNYPACGEGSLFDINYFLYANYGTTHCDWDSMLDTYTDGAYTDSQSQAVALLMMHCGMGVGMRYADHESGSQAQYVPGALRSHFRYNTNVNYRNRANHTNAEWMGSIYSELAAGRPLLYTGQDSKMSYGHAFVFDGYDTDGMVHVNWGWDGRFDGYFDINLLNSGYMGLSFTDLQSMVLGIGLPEHDISHSVELAIRSDLSLYGSGNTYQLYDEDFTVYNLNDYDLKGTLAMVMPTVTNTRIMSVIETYPNTDADTGEEQEAFRSFTYINYPKTYDIKIPTTLRNGTYVMYLAFREEGRSEWQPVYTAEGVVGYFVVTKDGSKVDVVGVRGQYTTPVETVPAAAPAGNDVYDLQGRRVSAGYRGLVISNGRKYIKH